MPKSKSHMPLLLDIIDASCTSRWIFVLARRTPQAPTQGLCVGMYSTCEVHAKYAHTRTRHTATHFQRSQGSKWPKFNDIFGQKKVQRLSSYHRPGTNLLDKKQTKAEVRRGLFRTDSMF